MTAELAHHDRAAPENDNPAGEGSRSSPDLDGPADDTGIRLVAPVPAVSRRARADVIHVGRLTLSTATIAWALSLLLHTGAILAACLAARVYSRDAALPSPWGGRSGAGGIAAFTGPVDAIRQGLPDVALLAAPSELRIRMTWSDHQDESTADWERARTLESRDLGDEATPPPLIGMVTSDAGGMGPAPRRHPRAARPGQPSGREQMDASSQGGSAGDATGPGLPGALVSRGLPTPDYPLEARRRGEQGTVRIAVEVLSDGSIGEIRVVGDHGFPLLRQAALSAAQKLRAFRFIPARRFGRPILDMLVVPYRFSLK